MKDDAIQNAYKEWCAPRMNSADSDHPRDAFAAGYRAAIALMRGQSEPRGWISDNDLLKLRESVDDARNIRMSTKRTHLRVHPVHIPTLAAMQQTEKT